METAQSVTCCTSMRIRAWIPSTQVKTKPTGVAPVLRGRDWGGHRQNLRVHESGSLAKSMSSRSNERPYLTKHKVKGW